MGYSFFVWIDFLNLVCSYLRKIVVIPSLSFHVATDNSTKENDFYIALYERVGLIIHYSFLFKTI